MKQLSTAEEFIMETYSSIPFELDQITELMQEFAKLHVKAALESAAENGIVDIVRNSKYGAPDVYIVDKQSILNVYPLENIK